MFDFIYEQREIFTFFGERAQRMKLAEEFTELIYALRSGDRDHIEEELADLHNVLCQFIGRYDTQRIHDIAIAKIERTKLRIDNGYYDRITGERYKADAPCR